MKTKLESLKVFCSDIKLHHSLFALPFAAASFVLSDLNYIEWWQILFLLVCMVSARSFGMGFNRLVDRHIDKLNERTAVRAIPGGRLSVNASYGWIVFFAVLFVGAAFVLDPTAGICAPLVLLILAMYSYMKRLSWLTHWYLGFCLGMAPVAVLIALNKPVPFHIILLGAAVMFWTAGFDLLYSLQDRVFDKNMGLHSVPSKFGWRAALVFSLISFVLMIACLTVSGVLGSNGFWYWVGVLICSACLGLEHVMVRDAWKDGTSKNINVAFFNVNAALGFVFLFFAVLDKS